VIEPEGILKGATISYLSLAAVMFFHRDAEVYSRLVMLMAWPMTVVAVTGPRLLAGGGLVGPSRPGDQRPRDKSSAE